EKPSGREVKIRQEFLEERLKERFEEKAGCTIQQVKALSLVGEGNTSETSKTMLTRALKRAFPSVKTKRTQEKGPKSLFASVLYADSPESEINNLKIMIAATDEVMTQIWDKTSEMTAENQELSELMEEYAREARERDALFSSLVKVYENELVRLRSQQNHDTLSEKQRRIIIEEFKILEAITCTGVRTTFDKTLPDEQVLNDSFFKEFVVIFQETCPLLQNVVETLLVSNLHQTNIHITVDYKVLCSTHALSLLLNVRSTTGKNYTTTVTFSCNKAGTA
ncbi:Hypothetical predicted protein, partial [Paramuricea clavata]